eukprot:TRINITY_DN479_c0_g2_i1.p1 TRINITY_DN479_c0_g2~~TRINITY_DN479_c0_g2_i1.p1  ORF type:complete len:468 (-),score=135.89 TRINITY_DN479_c0_g2_i1:58-1461(-)
MRVFKPHARAAAAKRVRALSALLVLAQLLWLLLLFRYNALVNDALHPRASAAQRAPRHQPPSRYLLLLDAWERMVNVQYALRRLLNVAVDANLSLVEPFMYQSKVQLHYSLPEMFQHKQLLPQAASTFFDSRQLYNTSHYVPYQRFEQHFALAHSRTSFIHAALFLTWRDAYWMGARDVLRNWLSPLPPPLWWCDSNLHRLPGRYNRSTRMFHITPSVQIARAVCAPPSALTNASFFHTLFDTLRAHVRATTPPSCAHCVSVAVANYRKHAVQSYISTAGVAASQPVAPLSLSRSVMRTARALLQRHVGDGAFVAAHIRSGKAYALITARGNYSAFQQWLRPCVQRLARSASSVRLPVYVAADLFNDGWLGGETAVDEVREALRDARHALSGAHMFRLRAERERQLVAQDHMGMASAIDAAAALMATHFVYAQPSNFGGWVAKLRESRALRSHALQCEYPPAAAAAA